MENDLRRTYSSERLAYWYFRINGFLTIENFVVHPETGPNQQTDVDLIAVRFRHREENFLRPMMDDPAICDVPSLANIALVEAKSSLGRLNDSWLRSAKNYERILRSVGCFPLPEVQEASKGLLQSGEYRSEWATVRIFVLADYFNEPLPVPSSQRLLWDHVVESCIERFGQYARQKSATGNWEGDGGRLKELSWLRDAAGIRRLFRL